ncbi:heparin lyase I family protein [Streptomyces phytohabitans]|uniref:heparin lyase I family protein n=1 Tax=Streptomyces phytohabitans TaxID=1150371 RepID=UPI00345C475D
MAPPQPTPRRRVLGYALAALPAAALTGPGPASAASRTPVSTSRTPMSRTTASARAGAPVPEIDVLWSTDFSDGWSGWLDTPWNDQPQGEVPRPVVVDAPTGQGRAGRFHLEGGQQRNESQPDAAQSIGEGDTLIVRFTDHLEDGFPVDTDAWQVVMQFKNEGEGSPPCEIKIGNGVYALDGDSGGWHVDIGPAETGRPIDITVRITFSADPATAVIDAWYGEEQTVTAYHPEGAGTLYDGLTSYLKTGLYRDPSIGEAGTRLLSSLVIGTPA